MEEKIKEFKALWPGYLEQVYSNAEIELWISGTDNMAQAIDQASDHMMAQGLGEVVE